MYQAERTDTSARIIAAEPNQHLSRSASTADVSPSFWTVGGTSGGEHGFPSPSDALRALGLAEEPGARRKEAGAGTDFALAARASNDGGPKPRATAEIDRDHALVSDSVSDDADYKWAKKFEEFFEKPGATPASVLHDLEQAAQAEGKNPDGSPKVSINVMRDRYGTRHYYAMFNDNSKQLRLNQAAVRGGNLNLQDFDGQSAAVAQIGYIWGLDGSLA